LHVAHAHRSRAIHDRAMGVESRSIGRWLIVRAPDTVPDGVSTSAVALAGDVADEHLVASQPVSERTVGGRKGDPSAPVVHQVADGRFWQLTAIRAHGVERCHRERPGFVGVVEGFRTRLVPSPPIAVVVLRVPQPSISSGVASSSPRSRANGMSVNTMSDCERTRPHTGHDAEATYAVCFTK
jgi:hypothetical protein